MRERPFEVRQIMAVFQTVRFCEIQSLVHWQRHTRLAKGSNAECEGETQCRRSGSPNLAGCSEIFHANPVSLIRNGALLEVFDSDETTVLPRSIDDERNQ